MKTRERVGMQHIYYTSITHICYTHTSDCPLALANVVVGGARIGDGGVRGTREDVVGVRHAVLHCHVGGGGAESHATQPLVGEGDVGLQRTDTVVLRAHPILQCHAPRGAECDVRPRHDTVRMTMSMSACPCSHVHALMSMSMYHVPHYAMQSRTRRVACRACSYMVRPHPCCC